MYSIKDNVENTIIIKKSKFISKIYRINSVLDINDILNNLKINYRDSSHICYAYIIDNVEKYFDDNEPHGTAGAQILNILKKNDLNYIFAVVIRYFGGIKLGTGGLSRAYSNSIIELLKLSNKVELIEGYLVEIEFNYKNSKQINKILNSITLVNKEYKDNIKYQFYIDKKNKDLLEELKKSSLVFKIIKKTLIIKN